MTVTLGVADITARSSVRSLPAKKWAHFVAEAIKRDALEGEAADQAVADGLLSQLVVPGAPGVLVSYLSYALDNGLLDARAFVVALLVRMYRAAQAGGAPLLPTSLLSSIATALLSASPGLGILPLPSPVPLPTDAPDVGTSAAAAAAGTEDVALLSLLMPLLRLWAVAPVPPPVVALAARLTALVPPLPVPPFELGLEGAQLTAVLPEDISKPLRECLAGLMADLPMPMPAPLFPTPRDAPFDANAAALASAPAPSPCVSALPLRQATSLLLEHALRAHRWSRNSGYARSPTLPPAPFRHLIRLGRALTADPHEFFVALLDAAVARIHASFAPGRLGTSSAVRAAAFLTHELPTLLRWWRDTADTKWPYPANNLRGALGGMFAEHAPAMQAYFQELTTLYAAKSAQGEPDDEAGPFVQPDGWALAPFEGLAVQRYVELGLLDEESTVVLTGSPVKPVPPGESLLERFVSAPPAHLPALEVIITYAAGAPQAFGAEVVKCLENDPQQPPPEDLLSRLAASPVLLTIVSVYIPPTDLLDLLTTHWLDRIEDESARAEDPQASLIRFGSGVVLAEAVCALFDLPLPPLLYDARRATNIGDLSEKDLASVNAWIKALFGSDGIDDETVMTTSTQGLARYTSTLVQQAVVAASMGQIDLDTLHSGLSYYAQPLLSWCLGGVVGWLCAEIERQGVLSGMHLKVLQGLVLDSAFPESLLRANARELSRLLDPAAGLQSVMQSSGFDHVAVRARLDAARGADGPPAPPVPALLRAELHAVYMNMAAPGWEARILDSLASTLRADGATRTLEDVLADMLYPDLLTMERAGVPNAPYTLAQLVALLAALPLNIPGTPLAPAVVDAYLPALFNPRSPFAPTSAVQPAIRAGIMLAPPAPPAPAPVLPLAAHTLHRLLRATLLAVEAGGGDEDPEDAGSGAREGQVDADGDESMEGGGSTRAARRVDVDADALASHLADELRFQTSRPDATAAKRAKRSTRGLGPGAVPDLGLSSDQRALVDELIKAIEGDDELRTRWPVLAPPQKEKE